MDTLGSNYNYFLESMIDAFVSVDMNGRTLHFNKIYQNMLGYEQEELYLTTCRDLTPERWHKLEEDIVKKQVIQTGYSEVYEKEYKRKDGTLLPVESRISLKRDEMGNPIEMWTVIRDISERRKLEEELLATNTTLSLKIAELNEKLKMHEIELETQKNNLSEMLHELQISRNRYSDLFEYAPVGYVTHNDKGIIKEVNRAGVALLGNERDQLLGKPLSEYVAPEDQLTFIKHLSSCKQAEGQVITDIDIRLNGGRVGCVQLNSIKVKSAKGTAAEYRTTITDISERKRIENALRASEERYVLAVQGANDGIWDTDLLTGESYFSPRWKSMLGYKESEIQHRVNQWEELIHPDDLQRTIAMKQSYLKGEIPEYRVEFRMRHKDGTYRWILSRAVCLRDEKGSPYRMAGSHTDITDAKMAENALRESEESLKFVLEGSQLGLWDWNIETNVVIRNELCAEMLGYRLAEIETTTKQWTDIIHPGDREAAWKSIRDHLEGRTAIHEIEYRMHTKDGNYKWILDRARIVQRDPHGRPLRMSGTYTDITNAKLAEEALRRETEGRLRALEALHEKDQALMHQSRLAAMGEMINNIAHQWRQPLNTLGLLVQQISLFYGSKDFTKEYLDTVTENAMKQIKHMSQTIDDFRNFFKPDKELMDFSIVKMIRQAISLVKDSFKLQNITVVYHKESDFQVSGYPNEFSQVLLNILLNAKDAFANSPTENALITIRSSIEDEKGVVTISDNAGGIPEAIKEKIFEPYFTTKGPNKGTGIGLFMAKAIIEKNMGGRLTAYNNGDGAEFRIEV